jgi:hypothetical protein
MAIDMASKRKRAWLAALRPRSVLAALTGGPLGPGAKRG